MRNTSKVTTLESKFPLLAVEQGCIVSKDADITVAFRVELPELFTVTSAEYEAMHAAWHKAVKVLPDFTIVHKQDWFVKERYAGKLSDGELSFLARASERHFNERPSSTMPVTSSSLKRPASAWLGRATSPRFAVARSCRRKWATAKR